MSVTRTPPYYPDLSALLTKEVFRSLRKTPLLLRYNRPKTPEDTYSPSLRQGPPVIRTPSSFQTNVVPTCLQSPGTSDVSTHLVARLRLPDRGSGISDLDPRVLKEGELHHPLGTYKMDLHCVPAPSLDTLLLSQIIDRTTVRVSPTGSRDPEHPDSRLVW